jgi:hypothetical protein
MPLSSRYRVAEGFALRSSTFYVVSSTLFKNRFYEERQCSLHSGQLATPSGAGFPQDNRRRVTRVLPVEQQGIPMSSRVLPVEQQSSQSVAIGFSQWSSMVLLVEKVLVEQQCSPKRATGIFQWCSRVLQVGH